MDCLTARLLLPFDRAGGRDLDDADRADLHHRLAGCAGCRELAGAGGRFDAAVGRAMRAVVEPAELRHRILDRLALEKGRLWRRRLYAGVGAVAAAAAVVFGVYGWQGVHRPIADAEWLGERIDERQAANPEQVTAHFKKEGLPFAAPPDFDFSQLQRFTRDELAGVVVPKLLFIHEAERKEITAEVYVLHKSHFKLDGTATAFSRNDASKRTILLRSYPHLPDFVFAVVIYGGGQIDDFLKKDELPGA